MTTESRERPTLSLRHFVYGFVAFLGWVSSCDAWVYAQVGTDPMDADLLGGLALATLGSSLAVFGCLLLAWSAIWTVAGSKAGESMRSRVTLALLLWACVILFDLATWPPERRRGDLMKLRLMLDAAAGIPLAVHVLRPRWLTHRLAVWAAVAVVALGIGVTCETFGTTALPLFAKIKRGPIAGIILLQIYFGWMLLTLYWGRPTAKLRWRAAGMACLQLVLGAPIAAAASDRATSVIVDTLEASRSLRVLHRRVLSLPGLGSLPGARRLVGHFPSPLALEGSGFTQGTTSNGEGSASGDLIRCDPDAAAHKSVVLLSIDSLRADYLGLDPSSLPNINELRTGGWTFPSTIQACSGTSGSMYAYYTGRYIHMPPPPVDPWTVLAHRRNARSAQLMQGWSEQGYVTASPEALSRNILDVVEAARAEGRTFLVHAHYMSTHLPSEWWSFEYDQREALRDVDRAIGIVVEGLQSLGVIGQTIVVVTGDHGDEERHLRGFLGHGFAVWDSSVLTPLILWTGTDPPRIVRERVSGTDLFPTLLQLLGCSARYPLHGRSLVGPVTVRPIYTSNYSPNPVFRGLVFGDKHAVSLGRFKLTVDRWENAWALYDLEADPQELRNLIDARPEVRAQLTPLLWSYLAGRRPPD